MKFILYIHTNWKAISWSPSSLWSGFGSFLCVLVLRNWEAKMQLWPSNTVDVKNSSRLKFVIQ